MNFHTWDPVAIERLSFFEGYSVLDCPLLRGLSSFRVSLIGGSSSYHLLLPTSMLYGGPLTYTEGYNYEKELTACKLMNSY